MPDIISIINEAPEGTRVSFLYPCIEGHSAETIVSLDELRALVQEKTEHQGIDWYKPE